MIKYVKNQRKVKLSLFTNGRINYAACLKESSRINKFSTVTAYKGSNKLYSYIPAIIRKQNSKIVTFTVANS